MVLAVERMVTSPPLGPGIAPRTTIMFSSGSTFTTSRFITVTWSTPMWPAPILPLKMRLGSVPEPMEPAWRATGPVPWVALRVWAPWRLTTPA